MLKEDLKDITIKDLFDTGQISARTANCCDHSELNSLYDLIAYYEKYESFFKFKIRNAGQITCLELDNLCKIYISQIEVEKEKECSDKIEDTLQLIKELTVQERDILLSIANLVVNSEKKFKKKLRQYGHYCSEQFVSDFYQKHCHLPMLWILEQNIKNSNSRELHILIHSYNIFKNHQLLTLDELAAIHCLSRERVRQIRINAFHNNFEITGGHVGKNKNDLTNLDILLHNNEDWSYFLDVFKNEDLICHESFEVQNHLKEERCNFSYEFFLHLLANLFYDKYCILGGIDIANKSNVWNNTFIIKREYADIFDFENLRLEFSDIIMDNDSEYLLDIEEYVANSPCWIKYDYTKNDNIISIVRDFLLYEFHLYSDDIDGRIKIPANKEKKPIDVIYEILQNAGKPMHLNEIFAEFKIILPEHKYTEASQLRPYIQKHEAISFRNRNSVYTLKEWDHIKAGTILDSIVEFLLEHDTPQTADDITEYVLQYFPDTNFSSVRTSMLINTPKRFSHFNNNKFGLNNKEYPPEYEVSEQQETTRRSFEQRLRDLELFIVEEEHFPFTPSDDSKESSLGRWWYRIINNKQTLNESQQAEVERVKAKYSGYDSDKTVYDWHINYNKLRCFVLENRHLPSSLEENTNDNLHYKWLKKTIADYKNNKLTEEQRQKFLKLAKMILNA